MKNAFRINYSPDGVSVAEFYPCLAYVNEEGAPVGGLFSSFVFDLSHVENNLSEWENAIDKLFAEERDLHALNFAYGDMRRLLSLSHKCPVYIHAPLPAISLIPFGDINRDGITEKLLDVADCVRAYEWFVNSVLRRFACYDFSELEFKGFLVSAKCSEELKEGILDVTAKNGVESVLWGEEDIPVDSYDVSARIELPFSGELRIFTSKENNFLSRCAVTQEGFERIVYRRLFEGLAENKPSENPNVQKEPEEIIEESAPITDKIPEAVPEAVPESVPETVAETVPEVVPEEPQLYDETVDDKSESEEELPVLDGTDLDRIFVDPSEEFPPKKKKNKPCDKKKLLIGAGVAAAVLGIAYIIKKATED